MQHQYAIEWSRFMPTRASIAEIQLAEVLISVGQRVTLMLGAANRDAERSNEPTDDGRERNQLRSSLNGGHGGHCIGMSVSY
jgi:cytochrome P450